MKISEDVFIIVTTYEGIEIDVREARYDLEVRFISIDITIIERFLLGLSLAGWTAVE